MKNFIKSAKKNRPIRIEYLSINFLAPVFVIGPYDHHSSTTGYVCRREREIY